MWSKVQLHFQTFWIKYMGMFIIDVIIVLAILACKKNGFTTMLYYCDAFFITAAVNISLGILSLLSYFGSFNGIGYIGYYLSNRVMDVFRKNEVNIANYGKYLEIKEEKKNKKNYSFIPYMIFGILFLAIALIIFCLLPRR